jgi:hypothetical protein
VDTLTIQRAIFFITGWFLPTCFWPLTLPVLWFLYPRSFATKLCYIFHHKTVQQWANIEGKWMTIVIRYCSTSKTSIMYLQWFLT